MSTHISQAELDEVKKTITDAEAERATLVELARAHEICTRAGAIKTLHVIRGHIHRMTPETYSRNMMLNIWAGLVSGILVTVTTDRLIRNKKT